MNISIKECVATVERVGVTFWVGGMWAVGYLALPVIFNFLDDRRLAGEISGSILKVSISVWVVIAALLLFKYVVSLQGACLRSKRVWIVATMLALLSLILFVLQPMMAEIKQQAYQAGVEPGVRFARLHGASSVAYLISSVLGLLLVAVKPQDRLLEIQGMSSGRG